MDLGLGVETDWESDGADYLTSRKICNPRLCSGNET